MKIYLNYGEYRNGELTWNLSPLEFDAVRVEVGLDVKRDSGVDSRQVNYSHVLSKKSTWDIIISADELVDPEKFVFLEMLYCANAWAIGGYQYGYGGSVYGYGYNNAFLLSEGQFPISYLEDSSYLPEIDLKFIELNPR